MGRWLARRLIITLITFIGITILVFTLMRLAPVSPVDLLLFNMRNQGGLPPGDIQALHDKLAKELGLDQPIPIQYLVWLKEIVTTGQMGFSFVTGRSSLEMVLERLPPTALLLGSALILEIPHDLFQRKDQLIRIFVEARNRGRFRAHCRFLLLPLPLLVQPHFPNRLFLQLPPCFVPLLADDLHHLIGGFFPTSERGADGIHQRDSGIWKDREFLCPCGHDPARFLVVILGWDPLPCDADVTLGVWRIHPVRFFHSVHSVFHSFPLFLQSLAGLPGTPSGIIAPLCNRLMKRIKYLGYMNGMFTICCMLIVSSRNTSHQSPL